MAKFIFKMQKVLDIKYRLEEQATAEYGVANSLYLEELEKLELLISKKEMYEENIRKLYEGKLNIREVNSNKLAIDKTNDMITEQEKVIQRAKKNMEKAREKLSNAMSERKMYEALKEKAFEEFLNEVKVQEARETDELVSYRFGQMSKED